MVRSSRSILVILLIIPMLVITSTRIGDVSAAGEDPPGPDRFRVVYREYWLHTWWLTRWADNTAVCTVEVDHEGIPTHDDIYVICGELLYDEWVLTEDCTSSLSDPETCSGYYLHYINSEQATRSEAEQLPEAVVWVSLDGCIPTSSTHRCIEFPTLILSGEEPLEGHSIVRIEGFIDGEPFSCSPICQIELGPTDEDGLMIEFWAYSSYGDSSDIYTAQVAVRKSIDEGVFYADLLTDRWRGAPLAPCAVTWNTLPPVGGLSGWLASPDSPYDLMSDLPYDYLAGNLIKNGLVDASTCRDLGLLENGYASPCGMEAARPMVKEWQNRFDNLIFAASQVVGVPAVLLKRIFARESQFWPGISSQLIEAGLGQLTENGADTTLLWNLPFYEQFCPTIVDPSECTTGYSQLGDHLRLTLQRGLVKQVDARCSDCPLGISMEIAEDSVMIFAETLLANCAQAGMVVELNHSQTSGQPTYEDLWRFTLVNYNAGPGCLGLAVNSASKAGEPLDWDHVSSHLTPACQGAYRYVVDITSGSP